MMARDLMKRDLVMVRRGTRLIDAIRLMSSRNVGSVLVVDEDGKLVGIFTERDLLRIVAEDEDISGEIDHYMSRSLVTVKPEEPLIEVVKKMVKANIRHIPVVNDEGAPVGIISARDILRHILSYLLAVEKINRES